MSDKTDLTPTDELSPLATRHRLFIAIAYQPPSPVRQLLEDLQGLANQPATRLRVVPENNLHITLRFLGNVEEDAIRLVSQLMNRLGNSIQPFVLALEGFGCFKNALWLGVAESEELKLLAEHVNRDLALIGLTGKAESIDRFRPHLTVARIGRNGKLKISSLQQRYGDARWGSIEVTEIHLYKSCTLPTGAVYEIIHSASLDGHLP